MKTTAFVLAFLAVALMSSLFAPNAKAQMRFSRDFSQSTLQIGVGSVVHNKEGFGVDVYLKWRHLSLEYTHTFNPHFSTPGLTIGVFALPFLKDRGTAFNPFLIFDAGFRTRIYGVSDEQVIGSENLKLVFAGGPGIGFSAGPVVVSGKIDFGCQYFPVSNPKIEWRVGGIISLVVFFDQIGTLGAQ